MQSFCHIKYHRIVFQSSKFIKFLNSDVSKKLFVTTLEAFTSFVFSELIGIRCGVGCIRRNLVIQVVTKRKDHIY